MTAGAILRCVILSGGAYAPKSNLACINFAILQRRSGLEVGYVCRYAPFLSPSVLCLAKFLRREATLCNNVGILDFARVTSFASSRCAPSRVYARERCWWGYYVPFPRVHSERRVCAIAKLGAVTKSKILPLRAPLRGSTACVPHSDKD